MEYQIVEPNKETDYKQLDFAFDPRNRKTELLFDKKSKQHFVSKGDYLFGKLANKEEATALFLFMSHDGNTQY